MFRRKGSFRTFHIGKPSPVTPARYNAVGTLQCGLPQGLVTTPFSFCCVRRQSSACPARKGALGMPMSASCDPCKNNSLTVWLTHSPSDQTADESASQSRQTDRPDEPVGLGSGSVWAGIIRTASACFSAVIGLLQRSIRACCIANLCPDANMVLSPNTWVGALNAKQRLGPQGKCKGFRCHDMTNPLALNIEQSVVIAFTACY